MKFNRAALLQVRDEQKLTQEQLAAKAGMVSSTISRLERGLGGEPSVTTITKLAIALDVDPIDLLIVETNGAAA
jgi:transcriptional regulator with XRE-family HTH domain